jgi:DNA recombination protein RmuC
VKSAAQEYLVMLDRIHEQKLDANVSVKLTQMGLDLDEELCIETMQAILKDVKMREQAHLIQGEVQKLMDDMGRFRERVLDLQRHFGQANADIEKILTSSERIAARGRKIETLDFAEAEAAAEIEHQSGSPSPGASALRPEATPSPTRGEGVDQRRNGGARVVRQPDLLAGE